MLEMPAIVVGILLARGIGRQTDWKEIANLSQYGVKKITRLGSARNKKLVVVVE